MSVSAGVHGESLLTWRIPEDADVPTVSLGLIVGIARRLQVPRCTIFLTWISATEVVFTLVEICPREIPRFVTGLEVSEWEVCIACGDPCEDADLLPSPGGDRTPREQNCTRCCPCSLCLDCSFDLASGPCCPLCLEVKDLPLLSTIQDRRARLINPLVYRQEEYCRVQTNRALLAMVALAWWNWCA